jgi:hypothetical protein
VKEELAFLAKTSQSMQGEGAPAVGWFDLGASILANVYFHPKYKRFGPDINKLLAKSRCNQIGAEAFMTELIKFRESIRE